MAQYRCSGPEDSQKGTCLACHVSSRYGFVGFAMFSDNRFKCSSKVSARQYAIRAWSDLYRLMAYGSYYGRIWAVRG